MEKEKIVKKENKKCHASRNLLIACAIIAGLNTVGLARRHAMQIKHEQYIADNFNTYDVTIADDNFTRILWLNYLSTTTKDEKVALAIEECLENLTEDNFNKVNSLLKSNEQYKNTIFSDIVTIEDQEGYYVNYTDLAKRKVAYGKQISIDHSKSVNVGGSTYIDVDELLSILYDNYKGELREITF